MADPFRAFRQLERFNRLRDRTPSGQPPRLIATIVYDDAAQTIAFHPMADHPCPNCGKPLERISYPGGYLNRDQWESLQAGDWWCESCPSNGRGRYGAYFWTHELQPLASPEPPL